MPNKFGEIIDYVKHIMSIMAYCSDRRTITFTEIIIIKMKMWMNLKKRDDTCRWEVKRRKSTAHDM